MSTEIAKRISDSIVSNNIDAIENAYEVIQTMLSDAFTNGTLQETRRQLSDYYAKEDRILTYLKRKTENPEDEMQYCVGKIVGTMDLLMRVAKHTDEQLEIQKIEKKSKHLIRCLNYVNEQPGISGMDLKQKLGMTDSGFSNFYKRVDVFQLLYSQKIGNVNYYYLTPRGRRALQNDQSASMKVVYEEAFVVSLLEAIADEVEAEQPNAAHVIIRANQRVNGSAVKGNTILIKNSIDRVINKKQFRFRNAQLLWRDTRGKYDSYSIDDEICFPEKAYSSVVMDYDGGNNNE